MHVKITILLLLYMCDLILMVGQALIKLASNKGLLLVGSSYGAWDQHLVL